MQHSVCAASVVPCEHDVTEQTLDITVLAGGPSSEREVSLASGHAVADALRALGHRVTLADISPDNLSALDRHADVIFVALHGQFGEDGQLQEILEARHLPYCGSTPQACRTAMDKHAAKTIFIEHDIPTPRFDAAYGPEQIAAACACWSMPVVVKPIWQGSSVGTIIVTEGDCLRDVMNQSCSQYGPTLIEQYIHGKELTVGILGSTALPIIEIRPDGTFYDYHAKYESDRTQYRFDIDIDEPTRQRIQALSVRAAECLGLRDFCRADWMLDQQGHPYLLEVNAIPGFTEHSLLPKAARQAGLDMPALCGQIVATALARVHGRTTNAS